MHNYVVYDRWQVFELKFGRTGTLYLSWATSLQNNPRNKNKTNFLQKNSLGRHFQLTGKTDQLR